MTEKEPIFSFSLILQLLLFIIIVPLLPLLITWRWDWWQGWVFALGMILSFVISRWLAARRNPDILAERSKITKHKNIEPWDKTLATLLGVAGLLLPLVGGLDARFGRPAGFPLWVPVVAARALPGRHGGRFLGTDRQPLLLRCGAYSGRSRAGGGPLRPLPLATPPRL